MIRLGVWASGHDIHYEKPKEFVECLIVFWIDDSVIVICTIARKNEEKLVLVGEKWFCLMSLQNKTGGEKLHVFLRRLFA